MESNLELEELYAYSGYLGRLQPKPDRNWLTPDENELQTAVIRQRILIWNRIAEIENGL
jgi:hypothetical protein